MAELVSKLQFQQALQNATKPGERPEDRSANGEVVTRYVGQLETAAADTAQQVEELGAQVLKLREEAEGAVPKTALERVEKEAAEVQLRLETEMSQLREQLAAAESEENPRVVALKEQLEQLGKARQEAVGSLEEMSHEATVPKATFEEAQSRLGELELEMAELAAQLKLAQSEDNPRVVALKEQLEQLGKAHEQATLKQQQVVERLEADVERLTRAAEDHPRQIKEITRRAEGEALKVEALQVEMRRYQEVAVEVSRLPHDQAATKLEEARLAHGAIEGDTPQDEADKAFLAHKIALLETKQAEHEAIQKSLEAAHQAGAEEALRRPELALERQSDIFRAQREQMAMDADILATPVVRIVERHEEIRAAHEKLVAARAEIVDAESQGVEVQLQALELDRQVAQLENQLQMLETLQKTLKGFEELGRGKAGLGLTELHKVTSESLRVETETLERLSADVSEARDEGAIAVQAEKVRGLEAQVEQLRVAVESYQEHAATQVAIDAQFLQRLVGIAPATVPAVEKLAFIWHAVQAIVHMQQILTSGFGPDATHHLEIQSLLEQIDVWNRQYFKALNDSVDAVHGPGVVDSLYPHLRYELPNILQTIVGYMKMAAEDIEGEIVARRATMEQLDIAHGQLDAVHDHTRDERAIEANRAEFAIENIYLNTLLAIQGVHQPLRDAHAAEKTDLEWQKTVLGTMQRLIVGFFSMLFSIPGMMIGGLQTVGHPLVGKK